jgi:hypothetical protein
MDNLAILTVEQDARYGQLFELAANELDEDALGEDKVNELADADAWQGLCEEWPELAKFDGARAGYAE